MSSNPFFSLSLLKMILPSCHCIVKQCHSQWRTALFRAVTVYHRRHLATAGPEKKKNKSDNDIVIQSSDNQIEVATFKEKGNERGTRHIDTTTSLDCFRLAQQAAKDTGYSLIVIAGVATLGGLCYLMLRELYSRETPNGIYKEASKMCLANSEVGVRRSLP